MPGKEPSPQLVVVGSSAGGIEALSAVVSTLATPFPAPIVIAQHLDPSRPSHLGEILARQTTLPVITVHEHEQLQAGTVYVVPSNHHIEVTDHDITLQPHGAGRPKPSIDLLLSSASDVYGDQLIAVILTGTGSDGAAGARAVKQAGGTVLIQNPSTAAYAGMPRAVEPQYVDIVADLPRIGPILFDLLNGVVAPAEHERDGMGGSGEGELEYFLDGVRAHTGIDFRPYKTPTVLRRLQRRIIAAGASDLAGYTEYLEQHPDEFQRLAGSFLIKVTDFMRDQELFDLLRDNVIPDLVRASRKNGNELRFWSAGCATGEEAYSLAILVLEVLGDELPGFTVRVFATDLDAEAVAFARRGLYPQEALAHLPHQLVDRYFTRTGGGYEVKKLVRSLVVFGEHDLGQSAPFPRMDMVLCRNVLIYFTRGLQHRAFQLFAFALRDGGYLALGKTETVSPDSAFFSPEIPRLKIYRRHGKERPTPPFEVAGHISPILTGSVQPRQKGPARELFQARQESLRSRTSRENLLSNLPVGVLVVDKRYDIQEINSAARRLLGIHTVAIGEDLLHLAQTVPNKEFRAAIDKAIREKTPTRLNDLQVPPVYGAEYSYLRIECHPQPGEHEGEGEGSESPEGGARGGGGGGDTTAEPAGSVLVLVFDVTEMVQARRELEEASTRQRAQAEDLAKMVTDLRAANDSLVAGNEETRRANAELGEAHRKAEEMATLHARQVEVLAQANREMLSANQEVTKANSDLRSKLNDLLATNEEAQAAMEEAETLNEELQASNEELETLNEELQATVEELNTSNSDLAARGDELEDLAASMSIQQQHIEREKAQLEAILAGLADAVLVVTPEGKPVLSNAAYRTLFEGSEDSESAKDPDRARGDGLSAHEHPEGTRALMFDEQLRPLLPGETPQARAARGEAFSMTFTLVTSPGGERRWLEAIGQPVTGNNKQRWGVVVVRDITDRSLRTLQEQFTSLASHELRTPLSTIKGYLSILARSFREQKGNEQHLEHVQIALGQVDRQMRLIEDLLDVARLQTGKFSLRLEPVHLDMLLRQVVENGRLLANGQTIELTVHGALRDAGEPGEPGRSGTTAGQQDYGRSLLVMGDATRIEQAVLNLLTNAITHAPAKSRIDVRLCQVHGTSADGTPEAVAEIDVQDYGRGIAAKDISQVFTRFYQVSQNNPLPTQGLGLGLFIARQIVEAHGGTISVVSTEGEGATFTIRLPLLVQKSEQVPGSDTSVGTSAETATSAAGRISEE